MLCLSKKHLIICYIFAVFSQMCILYYYRAIFSNLEIVAFYYPVKFTSLPTNYVATHLQMSEFYSNLNAMHLELKTLQNNTLVLEHAYIPTLLIYPSKQALSSCQNDYGTVGNWLSFYWAARSLAYWLDFDSEQCSPTMDSSFIQYLPTANIGSRNRTTDHGSIQNNTFSVLWPMTKSIDICIYVHCSSLLLMFYNQLFQRIISHDMNNAISKYYEYHPKPNAINIETNDDIVIHIRCGDILTVGHGDYGFLTSEFYKFSVFEKANWTRNRISNSTTVWIISQLSKTSLRDTPEERYSGGICYQFVNYLVNNMFKQIFAPANIRIAENTDVTDDYYRMINAPLLICSESTFCLHAAIANENGTVILPSTGPWIDLTAVPANVLPANHVIIKSGKLRCSSVGSPDCVSREGKSLLNFAFALARYLSTH